MASGRVDARPSILKTLQSPNPGEGFRPLTPPTAPAQPTRGSPGKDGCPLLLLHLPANVQYLPFVVSSTITKVINVCYTSLQTLFCLYFAIIHS